MARYAGDHVLGRGGMGEVRVCHDERVGRDVAMKVILDEHAFRSDVKARFVREARVQGRLEHPAIVPVYDIGTDSRGRPFFTMKRVNGLTFADIVDGLAAGDAAIAAQLTRHKLLAAFGNVCLAIHYAHCNGVVHRDLKPANVIVGDFGEVYVLDWGIAKVEGEDAWADRSGPRARVPEPSVTTQAGSVLGTVGYMAPEHLTDGTAEPRSDVYALGAILFELLALSPLHVGTVDEIVLTTIGTKTLDARPSVRAPDRDVPPELDAICVKATALRRDDRFASAKELYDALEAYLSGDRDLERRAELAREHAARARDAAAIALEGADDDNTARARAMAETGRALALDPHNALALETMTRLLIDAPRTMPPDARASFDESARQTVRLGSRAGLFIMLAWFSCFPVALAMGVRSWAWLGFMAAAFGTTALACLLRARRPESALVTVMLHASAAAALFSVGRLFGPLVLMPTAAFGYAIAHVQSPSTASRRFGLALSAGTVVAVLALEAFGVLPRSYVFHDGRMEIVSQVVRFPAMATQAFLFLASAGTMLAAWVLVRRVRNALSEAQRRMTIQAWHLRQMVPEQARHAVSARSEVDAKAG